MKRKRPLGLSTDRLSKKQRLEASAQQQHPAEIIQHPVLSRVGYSIVCNLRHYLLARTPPGCKKRRRKLSQLAKDGTDERLRQLLDGVLVGVGDAPGDGETRRRGRELEIFSQETSDSTAQTDIAAATVRQHGVCQNSLDCPDLSASFRSYNGGHCTHPPPTLLTRADRQPCSAAAVSKELSRITASSSSLSWLSSERPRRYTRS